MSARQNDQPYLEFLAKHRSLSNATDAVIEGIAGYSHLDSVAALRAAADELRHDRQKPTTQHLSFAARLERGLRPGAIDKLTVQRLALVCRAVEVELGLNVRHYQIAAALLLRQGLILEMPNGSGKTLAGAISAAVNALAGLHTHIASANDYLAERDLRWMGPIFRALGIRCAMLCSDQSVTFQHGILGTADEGLIVATNPGAVLTALSPPPPANALPDTSGQADVSDIPDISEIPDATYPNPVSGANSDAVAGALPGTLPDTNAPAEPEVLSSVLEDSENSEDSEDSEALNDLEELFADADGLEAFDDIPTPFPQHSAQSDELHHVSTGKYTFDEQLSRADVLACDIVFGRLGTFAFAYLWDQRMMDTGAQSITRRDVLIVDECDIVLLDDFTQPLQITQSTGANVLGLDFATIRSLFNVAQKLIVDIHFRIERGTLFLTDIGHQEVETITGVDFYVEASCGLAYALVQVLTALELYKRNEDYVVHNQRIVVVEKRSGRLEPDRIFSNGLHSIIEIKEGLALTSLNEQQPMVETKVKDFVLTYQLVSGMSGVVGPEQDYARYYHLPTTHMQPYSATRTDLADQMYLTQQEAQTAIVSTAIQAAGNGRAVLVNVPTIAAVDALAPLFAQGICAVQILDGRTATTLGEEARIIEHAGRAGVVTLCSRVAARGTDIKLTAEARDNGGLLVLGLERNRDRRYDDQLRGRAARFGDPGESQFFLSLQDSLIKEFSSERMTNLMKGLGMDDGEAVEHRWVTNAIQRAQNKVRLRDQINRAQSVALDDVLARHRTVYFYIRQKLLEKDTLDAELGDMIENWVHYKEKTLLKKAPLALDDSYEAQLFGGLRERLDSVERQRVMQIRNRTRRNRMLRVTVEQKVATRMASLRDEISPSGAASLTKQLVLQILSNHWIAHLASSKRIREEAFLLREANSATSRYMEEMEATFDRFFYSAGEEILNTLLGLKITSAGAPGQLD